VRAIPRSAWLLAAASGVLQALIFPSPSLAFLSWVAFAPLLVALLRTPGAGQLQLLDRQGRDLRALTPRHGFLLGYGSGVVWYAGSCFWVLYVMRVYGHLATPVAFGVLVLFCLYLALYHGAFGMLLVYVTRKRPGAHARALAVAPFLWVAAELARARISGFPWDLLGTAQVDNVPLTRIATVTGVYGVSFAIMLVNCAFAAAFLVTPERRNRMLAAATLVAVVLQLAALYQPPAQPATHAARLVQQNIPILDERWSSEYFIRTLAELAQLSLAGEPLPATPRLIVWPESPAPFYVHEATFREQVTTVAQRANAHIIAGALGVRELPPQVEPSEVTNSAVLVAPSGEWAARYDKVHLVPFGEYVPFQKVLFFAESLTRQVSDFKPGRERTVFRLDGHTVGVFICYESIFPDEVRLFAAGGAELLVNISNDGWFGEYGAPWQHLNMARMRAIENGRWLLRSTNTGVTAVVDPFGRVVASAPRNTRTVLDAPYSFVSGTTFYTRHGDWFAWLCAIIALAAVVIRFRFRFMKLD
jgi:apolipoprotein N-acyltransferase